MSKPAFCLMFKKFLEQQGYYSESEISLPSDICPERDISVDIANAMEENQAFIPRESIADDDEGWVVIRENHYDGYFDSNLPSRSM